MSSVLELHVLLCGIRFVPQPMSIGADPAVPCSAPITVAVAKTLNGTVLFDAGLDPRHVADPVRRAVMFETRGWTPAPLVDESQHLEAQLARVGLRLADIDQVVVSHLHAEATGGLKALPGASIIVQRAEHEAAFAVEGPPDAAYFPLDYDVPNLKYDLVDGDRVVDQGLTLIATPGHTAGHQSLIVELNGAGPIILAGGASPSRAGLAEHALPVCADADAALRSLRQINALAWELGGEVVVSEDPGLLQTLAEGPWSVP